MLTFCGFVTQNNLSHTALLIWSIDLKKKYGLQCSFEINSFSKTKQLDRDVGLLNTTGGQKLSKVNADGL